MNKSCVPGSLRAPPTSSNRSSAWFLVFGTIKGTLYALLFAVPIAIQAAPYTSQFAHPTIR
jgi:ABC-type uncharacterized transport system permease subunit